MLKQLPVCSMPRSVQQSQDHGTYLNPLSSWRTSRIPLPPLFSYQETGAETGACPAHALKWKGKRKLKWEKIEWEGEKMTFCLVVAVVEILVWCHSSWTGSVLCLHSPPVVTLPFYSLPLPSAALLQPHSGERLPLCFSPNPSPNPCAGSG